MGLHLEGHIYVAGSESRTTPNSTLLYVSDRTRQLTLQCHCLFLIFQCFISKFKTIQIKSECYVKTKSNAFFNRGCVMDILYSILATETSAPPLGPTKGIL